MVSKAHEEGKIAQTPFLFQEMALTTLKQKYYVTINLNR